MKPVMYLFLNKGLGMSLGKSAAQAAHAAVNAAEATKTEMLREWNRGGHYTKLVMEARDTEHLLVIERYLKERKIKTCLIIDEGRTEIAPHTPTALGVEVVDKDNEEVAEIFSSFRTYRDPKPEPPKRRVRDVLGSGGFALLTRQKLGR